MTGQPRHSRTRNRKSSKPSPATNWWTIRDIIGERRNKGKLEYLVDWENDPNTGEAFDPTWSSPSDVTAKAIFDWKRKHQGLRATAEPTSPDSVNSSQSVRDPNWRKRRRANDTYLRADSSTGSSEDEAGLAKRQRVGRDTALQEPESDDSSSLDCLENISDILVGAHRIIVELPRQPELDPSEYQLLSLSSSSISGASQPISEVRLEDSQAPSAAEVDQRTIPDSQEYTAGDTSVQTESQPQSQTLLQLSTQSQAAVISETIPAFVREIPDSQKESTLNSIVQTPVEETSPSVSNRLIQDLARPVNLRLASNPVSDIPSRQPDDHLDASRSPSHIAFVFSAPESQNSERGPPIGHLEPELTPSPFFLTQLDFATELPDFESSIGEPESQDHISEGVTNSAKQTESITAEQAAQIIPNLLGNFDIDTYHESNSTGESVVPDTVLRKAHQIEVLRDTTPSQAQSEEGGSERQVQPDSPDLRSLAQVLSSPAEIWDSQELGDGKEDYFQSCVERHSIPLSGSAEPHQADADSCLRQSLRSTSMESSSSRPLSAVEELMQLQQAAIQEALAERPLYSPTGVPELTTQGESLPATNLLVDTSVSVDEQSIEPPSIHINSLPQESSQLESEEALGPSLDVLATVSDSAQILASALPEFSMSAEDELRLAANSAFNSVSLMSGTLLPSPIINSIPTTVSPSEISRSIEPEDADLLVLPQIVDSPQLGALNAEEETVTEIGVVSSASSLDDAHQYSLPVPLAPLDTSPNEYTVTIPFPVNIAPQYLGLIRNYKSAIEAFTQCMEEGKIPEQHVIHAIDRLIAQLLDFCDYPPAIDGPEFDLLSAGDLKKHAVGTNTKFFFVANLLDFLKAENKKVLIVARSVRLLGYLEAVVGTSDILYTRSGLGELQYDLGSPLQVVLADTDQDLSDAPSDFDVVIGFDYAYTASPIAKQLYRNRHDHLSKKPMVISLVITYSVEHLDLAIPRDQDELERKNALLISIFRSRPLLAEPERGDLVDNIAAEFAKQIIDPNPNFIWQPEEIPGMVLDFYHSSQVPATFPQDEDSADPINRKRKLGDSEEDTPKRMRVASPAETTSKGATSVNIDEVVRNQINPDPTHRKVVTTQSHLDSLAAKISDFEGQLKEKGSLEADLRRQITRLSKQVKSYDKTFNDIQRQHLAALHERSKFEAERKEATALAESATAKLELSLANVSKLEAQLAKTNEVMKSSDSSILVNLSDTKRELDDANQNTLSLKKKTAGIESELQYTRNAYQGERQANGDLTASNADLRGRITLLERTAAENFTKIQRINAAQENQALQRMVIEAQTIAKDRERELDRVREELRSMKNGRRETRQQSVPRSPRMGVMSPRPGRVIAAPASRGTSPAPASTLEGAVIAPPVPGMTYFNQQPGNGRWGHLRD